MLELGQYQEGPKVLNTNDVQHLQLHTFRELQSQCNLLAIATIRLSGWHPPLI